MARERERDIYYKKANPHISLWEHSSHFRLIGRGIPSVPLQICCFSASVLSPLSGLPEGKSPGPHMKARVEGWWHGSSRPLLKFASHVQREIQSREEAVKQLRVWLDQAQGELQVCMFLCISGSSLNWVAHPERHTC